MHEVSILLGSEIEVERETMYKAIPPIRETPEELKQRRKQERHWLKQQRLQALYLLATGQAKERQEVARLMGVSRNTVGRWLDSYEQGGLAGLLTIKPLPGKAPALSETQLTQLRAALARPEGFGSYGEVQAWIAKELGVEMKYHAVHKLVHDKLGARLKVARPSHPKKATRL